MTNKVKAGLCEFSAIGRKDGISRNLFIAFFDISVIINTTITLFENSIALQLDGFFSGLGGSLSLYLGIAVTMAFEILELLFDLTTRAFGKQQMGLDGTFKH